MSTEVRHIKNRLFEYQRVGVVSRTDILGHTVYMRVANARWILGMSIKGTYKP